MLYANMILDGRLEGLHIAIMFITANWPRWVIFVTTLSNVIHIIPYIAIHSLDFIEALLFQGILRSFLLINVVWFDWQSIGNSEAEPSFWDGEMT